jgi:uncharacterized Zn finger protein
MPPPPPDRDDTRDGPYPRNAPKLPPPEHGIKARGFGTTWWGERWIEALHRFGARYALRLGRGRVYARQGRVHDLAVRDGVVSAHVTGSRPTPYIVTLRLARLSDAAWEAAIRAMAVKARIAARLLAGEMPREIDRVFASAGANLFPHRAADLAAGCTCPDNANPCKHIAALHFVLGQAFDRDPFLLFELRGRSKEAVLTGLRRLRSGGTAPLARGGETAERGPEAAAVTLRVGREAYDKFRAPVGDLRFEITPPAVEGAIVRQLGSPPRWDFPIPLDQLLRPAVTAAARLAREIALASPPTPDEGSEPPRDASS